jgi:UBX domain-containing protein 1
LCSIRLFQAFAGQGQMLGSPAPTVATLAAAAPTSAGATASNEQKAISQLNLVESEPTTSVQIRLADGSRLVGRFNHTHTVGQLRQYIIT